MYYVYILRSVPTGRLYVGTTRDLKRRLRDHNAGYNRGTRGFAPFELVHVESFPELAEARKREWHLKCTPAGGKEKARLAGRGRG